MRIPNWIAAALLLLHPGSVAAQSTREFSGEWRLNMDRSEIHNLPTQPDPVLKVENNGLALEVRTGDVRTYLLDGREAQRQVGGLTMKAVTKWEGAALLVNTLVSGPENYTVMERWKQSRDGSTLTIRKTIIRLGGESESLLVYENPALIAARLASPPPRAPSFTSVIRQDRVGEATEAAPQEWVVDAGTRILLRLVNAVDTRHTAPGDRVYLETAYPVFVRGHLVIPRGSYVAGTVTESQRAGRVKGKSALDLRFDSITLPNGTARDFRSRVGSVDAKGDVDRGEGRIKGESNKGGDARTVATTTAAGAGIGTLAGGAAGHYGMGAGIGAAAGAAAGLAGVLMSRGPDVVLRQGTTMEMVLGRELRFTPAELSVNGR